MSPQRSKRAVAVAMTCTAALALIAFALAARVRQSAEPVATGSTNLQSQPRAQTAGPGGSQAQAQTDPRSEPHIELERDRSGTADQPLRSASTPAAAAQSARGFLRGFLRYERGDRAAGSAMIPFAEARLAGTLLAEPPRIPPTSARPPAARLRRLGAAEYIRGGRLEIVAVLERAGRQTSMLLTLRRHGHRWLVSAVE